MTKKAPKHGLGWDIVCPSCKGKYHQTTSHFNDDQPATGVMMEWKEKYGPKGHNWSCFPFNTDAKSGWLECPNCGAPYCDNQNKLTVVPSHEKMAAFKRKETIAHVCPGCGKVYSTRQGVAAHSRFCKGLKEENKG